MATAEELINQYKTDPELQKEVDDILKDKKITPMEFMQFAHRHDVKVSLADLPEIIRKAREEGLID